jgi:hypothetical protein
MLATVLMATWLAQAEAAPPEPAAPAPAAPAPALDPAPRDPVNALGLQARLAYRLGSEGSAVGPAAGFSVGATFAHRYLLVARVLELAAALDLFHDNFTTAVTGSTPGTELPYAGERTLTQTSFALLQVLAVRGGPLRAWVAGGAGVTIAYFSSPERTLRPGSSSATQPLARAAAGIDVDIGARTAVCLRADFTHPLTRPSFTSTAGQTYSLFGDLFDAGVGVQFRF